MFDAVTTEGLRELARTTTGHHLSVFMPTHPPGAPARAQDPIRLRQLLDRARDQLVDLGMRRPDAEEFLAPATALVGDAASGPGPDPALRSSSMPTGCATTGLRMRPNPAASLPTASSSDRSCRPSPTAITTGCCPSANTTCGSCAATAPRACVASVSATSTSLEEALRFDDRERQLQSHASSRAGAGGVAMTMHGQGGIKDTTDDERTRFAGSSTATFGRWWRAGPNRSCSPASVASSTSSARSAISTGWRHAMSSATRIT
ncbi:MAG: hypothetical protein R2710_21120 [Acidimicrobiales bacterium]